MQRSATQVSLGRSIIQKHSHSLTWACTAVTVTPTVLWFVTVCRQVAVCWHFLWSTVFTFRVPLGTLANGLVFPVVLYGCETWSLTLREERRLRVFEKRVLRIFGLKRDEVTGEWRKLHSEELNDLYSSPNIVNKIISRRMKWAVHVTGMGRGEAYTGVWCGNVKERDHLGEPGVDGRIILRCIFRN